MITIIDYGMGNLRSVSKALEYLGARFKIATRGKDLFKATKVILPGVGAFGDAMNELTERGFVEPIQELCAKKIKLMGICLGLQLFFEKSDEAPKVRGLGILKGKVQSLRSTDVKVPHMGWNDIEIIKKHPLLEGIQTGDYFYFVHSYFGKPASSALTLATCRYGRKNFPAIVGNSHLFAAQFHPEKSQDAGLKILKNFIGW